MRHKLLSCEDLHNIISTVKSISIGTLIGHLSELIVVTYNKFIGFWKCGEYISNPSYEFATNYHQYDIACYDNSSQILVAVTNGVKVLVLMLSIPIRIADFI